MRKRAPKLERGTGEPAAPKRRLSRSLPRMRRGEIPGIALDSGRPYGTMAVIAASLVATIVIAGMASRNGWSTARAVYDMGGIYGPLDGDWWRLVAAPFLHDNAGYQFVALVAVGVFGTALERRFAWYAPVFIFVLAGAAGTSLAVVAKDYPALGANGAALGLLAAWFVEYRLTRAEEGDSTDVIGAAVFAAVLILLSVASDRASIAAAVGGAAAGSLCGFMLAQRSH